jgi:hypothetical protein
MKRWMLASEGIVTRKRFQVLKIKTPRIARISKYSRIRANKHSVSCFFSKIVSRRSHGSAQAAALQILVAAAGRAVLIRGVFGDFWISDIFMRHRMRHGRMK